MESQDDHTISKVEDNESYHLPVSPAGEGDVKPIQSSTDKFSSPEQSQKQLSKQSTKKSLFSRLLGATFTQDPNSPSEDIQKFKSNSLGKLFRNKSGSSASQEHFNTVVDNPQPNLSVKNSVQTSKKPFGSLLSAFQRGNRDRANSLPWSKENAEQLPKERGGSLGKFFRYGQGKKNKDNKNTDGSTHTLEAIDSESEYVTLPLDDNPFRDESDEEETNIKQNRASTSSTPRSDPVSTPRSFHDD